MKVTQLEFGPGQAAMRRKLEKARHAAKYFGAEAVANDESILSYQEDIALRYGYKAWKDMPRDIRKDALKCYMAGRRAELELKGK